MPGEASLSQELPTPGLLQAQVLVGYQWQNIGLGPDDSVPTATEATSCRNFPNCAGYFHSTRLSRPETRVCLDRLSPDGSRPPPHGRGRSHSPAVLRPILDITPGI